MKPEVEKLVFTELEEEENSNLITFVAESPVATYYIDYNKSDKTYRSWCMGSEIGTEKSLIKAIQAVNTYHRANILDCLVWE